MIVETEQGEEAQLLARQAEIGLGREPDPQSRQQEPRDLQFPRQFRLFEIARQTECQQSGRIVPGLQPDLDHMPEVMGRVWQNQAAEADEPKDNGGASQ